MLSASGKSGGLSVHRNSVFENTDKSPQFGTSHRNWPSHAAIGGFTPAIQHFTQQLAALHPQFGNFHRNWALFKVISN
jgi:hypothetical protein